MYFGQIKQEKIVFLLFWIKKSFLHQKKKLLKKSKNSKFSKRVSPWFLTKNRTFCHVCLYPASRGYIFAVWAGVRKVATFARQLIPRKCSLCSQGSMSFGQIKPEKIVFGILDKKECFLDQKKEVLKNDKKSTFSKGVSPQFLSKNWTFYHLCFLGKSRQRRSFWSSG